MIAAMDIASSCCSMSRTSAIAPSSSLTQQLARHSFRTNLRLQQVGTWHAPQRGLIQITNIGWDPEGILGAPVPHHIARREFAKKVAEDAEYKEKVERQLQAEKEARRLAREARVVPESHKDLLEYFLTTEGPEMEYEVARCRTRLTPEFFSFLKSEIGSLRFAVNKTVEVEDRIGELEVLQSVLQEGVEAYDKLATDLTGARERLSRILTAKDKRATLLEMAGENQLDRSLLALLDENIATASKANEVQAAQFMEKIRGAVVKYITI
ncbi:uncharacterized protein [Physcomitrium patens]|uniref:Uncharacterized protein n=1 Tax=Physcomitrium patens TaxID=3218 RepID=A0A2K1JYP4_PHYPA|nr:uncharacterized protein LOC112287411 [Physcomitrium patens]PNR46646.1 hypothetical protein PHYPA_013766 [Physcomitrium patens]|eukprot:XP_024386124.1 uncharacterized protein LOC112287411 [Physcomitrella patens]